MIVNERVIPYMPKPTLLADYLTDSFNAGGLVSLLALNGLFTLMHRHNLDYPSFFPNYTVSSIATFFTCRYRKMFLQVIRAVHDQYPHACIPLLPPLSSCIARLSLDASPAVINWVIPFVYNMFKAHLHPCPHSSSIFREESKVADPFRHGRT